MKLKDEVIALLKTHGKSKVTFITECLLKMDHVCNYYSEKLNLELFLFKNVFRGGVRWKEVIRTKKNEEFYLSLEIPTGLLENTIETVLKQNQVKQIGIHHLTNILASDETLKIYFSSHSDILKRLKQLKSSFHPIVEKSITLIGRSDA